MQALFTSFYYHFSKKIDGYSTIILKATLAVVYFWFGALKIFEISPAEILVQKTVYWLEPSLFVPFLGIAEMIIGVGLLIKKWAPITLLLLLMHMAVTFFPMIVVPKLCFDTTLFCPTLTGQYIIKNLVLIAAALAIIGKHHKSVTL